MLLSSSLARRAVLRHAPPSRRHFPTLQLCGNPSLAKRSHLTNSGLAPFASTPRPFSWRGASTSQDAGSSQGETGELADRQQSSAAAPSPSSSSSSSSGSPPPSKRRKWLLRLLFIAIGLWALDNTLNDEWDSVFDLFRWRISPEYRQSRPKVVVLGTGWGALSFIRKLHTDKYDVTIVSPRNYFLFTPLLPSTTVGTLEVRSIMEPVRHFIHRSNSQQAQFVEAECVKIDKDKKTIRCVDNSKVKGEVQDFELPYDHLIVAVGCDTATFNIPGVKENAVFLRSKQDTNTLRNRALDCLETASIPGQTQSEIDRLLSIVVVGGGPAGVEYCAELGDWLHSDLRPNYKEVVGSTKIHLIEALPNILNMFDKNLIEFVETGFKKNPNKPIQLHTQTLVTEVTEKEVITKLSDGTKKSIPYGMLVWAAGNATRPLVKDLMASIGQENGQTDRRGLKVNGHFQVHGADGIWAVGDCAISGNPATAQVAAQEGKYLGRLFNSLSDEIFDATVEGKDVQDIDLPPFEYKNFGSFAYVGDHEAIAQIDHELGGYKNAGVVTYILWRSVYMSKLLSVRNRFSVAVDWFKALVFGRDISRG